LPLEIIRDEVDRAQWCASFLAEDVGDRRGDDAGVQLRAVLRLAPALEELLELGEV